MISAIHTSNVMNVVPSVMSQRRYNAQSGAAKTSVKRADPLSLERIDLQIEIVPVPFEKISEKHQAEPSSAIRERVMRARKIQQNRFAQHEGIYCNAQMESRLIHQYAEPDEQSLEMLRNAMTRLNLSARAYDRILKVARTIADLEGFNTVQRQHIAEAIGYRSMDRENWIE